MADPEPVGLSDSRVLVLAGPTAAGKSELAVRLAEAVGGAVVSADSRQVYRGLEIGSAQPDAGLRARVPHFLVGFLSPEAEYSAGAYAADAGRVLAALAGRGVPAVVCGGTGLYLRALLTGAPGPAAALPPPSGPTVLRRRRRAELTERGRTAGATALHAELAVVDPALAAALHPHDRQRVIRGLEFHAEHGARLSRVRRPGRTSAGAGGGPLRFRLELPLPELEARIARRVDAMLRAGWLDEARGLAARYGGDPPRALQALGYAEIFAALRGELALADALERVLRRTRRYAKRQRTWFRHQDGYAAVRPEEAFPRLLAAWRERLA